MIGLAAAAIPLAPAIAGASSHPGRLPLSVVVHATGARDVSYAIDVHTSTDHPVPDAAVRARRRRRAASALERAGIEG